MIFSTYEFLLLFLPITFIGYFLLNRFRQYDAAKIWLVIASFAFYGFGSPDFFPFFLASVVLNYIFGMTMGTLGENAKIERKVLLTVSVLGNVGLLGYYKYTDFFIENINAVAKTDFPLQHIILPIGISFFTFQLIAFLVDSYRGQTQEYNIVNYLLFVTFFPQLIVGPIIHHKEMVPQFANKKNLIINYDNIAKGLFIFSIGCAKKMLLADPLTTDAQLFYGNMQQGLPFWEAWFCSIEYTISYYFDLSGYADMAIGLGWMFNIKIPQNFNSPFKASDFQEYWKRWHITLSRFLGDYIFRSVYKKNNKWRNYYIATMVTFFVSGFWHGSGWTFIVWGLVNGALVCLAAYRKKHDKKTPYIFGVALTFLGVVMTRVLFVSNSFKEAFYVFKAMFPFQEGYRMAGSLVSQFKELWAERSDMIVLCAIVLGICWFLPNTLAITEKFKVKPATLLYAAVLIGICVLKMDQVVQFLYFQF